MLTAALIDKLNRNYSMIGLSADWVYHAWLISGNKDKGEVIFENEDNGLYELLSFYYDEDEMLVADLLCSGTLEVVVEAAHFPH